MIINSEISDKTLNKLIRLANTAEKPRLKYFIVASSIIVAGFCTYLSYLNSNNFALIDFLLLSIFISSFLFGFSYLLYRVGIEPGLYNLKCRIDEISQDDWSCNLLYLRNLSPFIVKHPVTKCIIGLYVFKYGKESDGLEIIAKAAEELPDINRSIKEGKISDNIGFKKLHESIYSDVYPTNFVKYYNLVTDASLVFSVCYAIVVIIIVTYRLIPMFKNM